MESPVVEFEVLGLPPAKRGDMSALGAASNQRPKVIALLKAAWAALAKIDDFEGFGSHRLRLEITVYATAENETWDATNYLGGIADVLEGKAKRLLAHPGSLDHLEELRTFGLYDDDRQIKEISYRETPAGAPTRYKVKLSALKEPAASPGGFIAFV